MWPRREGGAPGPGKASTPDPSQGGSTHGPDPRRCASPVLQTWVRPQGMQRQSVSPPEVSS